MDIQEQVPLCEYTTLQVGGPARYFCTVNSVAELQQARQFALHTDVPVLLLGSGSNVLIQDQGFAGLVIHNHIQHQSYTVSGSQVTARFGAGDLLDNVIAQTVSLGYWGLENLSHIPGTVGATPVQNVGAYGVEISDVISTVEACHLDTGEERVFSNADCQFAYRDSFFKSDAGSRWCITAVLCELITSPTPILTYKDLMSLQDERPLTQQLIRETVIKIRAAKFPDWTVVGTAGSFFKNPIIPTSQAEALIERYPDLPVYAVSDGQTKVSLGYILDKICGLKGYTQGSVGLFDKQALVLVNTGTSAGAVTSFAADVIEQVFEHTGITIEQEVRTV